MESHSTNKRETENQIEYIVNLTIGEYFVSNTIKDRENKMRNLFKKLTEHTAILRQSIGTSRWEKTDVIKLISKSDNKKLCEYVTENYSSIWMNDN